MAKIFKAESIQTQSLGNNDNTAFPIQRNNSTLITLNTSDNVGIGTTSPGSKLTVNGASEVDLRIESSTKLIDVGGKLTFALTNSSDSLYDAASIRARNVASNQSNGTENTYLSFHTRQNGVLNETLRIDRDGNLKIMKGTLLYTGSWFPSAGTNLAFGSGALSLGAGPGYAANDNIAIGNDALNNNFYGGDSNIAIGKKALNNIQGGPYANPGGAGNNIAIGENTLLQNYGKLNIGIGKDSLSQSTGNLNIAIGSGALQFSSGNPVDGNGQSFNAGNIGIGCLAIRTNYNGYNNIGIGNACLSQNFNGHSNVAVGERSLYSNTNGTGNMSLGMEALYSNIDGHGNIGIGFQSLYKNTQTSFNIAIGYQSQGNTTSSSSSPNNISIGTKSLFGGSSNINNIAIGKDAMLQPSSSSDNTAIGHSALSALGSVAAGNVAIGNSASQSNTSAQYNTAVGWRSLYTNITSPKNVAVGAESLYLNKGAYNTAVGYQASYTQPTIYSTTAVGYQALFKNITDNNTAVGSQALYLNDFGKENTAVGCGSLTDNIGFEKDSNTAVGYFSMNAIIGKENTAVGAYSLNPITYGGALRVTGSINYSTAVGYYALSAVTGAYNNVAVGHNALNLLITGHNNTAIGKSALAGLKTGLNNIGIGRTYAIVATGNNNIYIGNYNAITDVGDLPLNAYSNTIALGNINHNRIFCNVTAITAYSDARDKKDIETLPVGLDFINELRPVKFVWDTRKGGKVGETDLGFIAQESLQTVNKYNANWMDFVTDSDPEQLYMTPGKLIPVLVKAVQDLKRDFDLYVSGQALKT
jgi:hypothetical protein